MRYTFSKRCLIGLVLSTLLPLASGAGAKEELLQPERSTYVGWKFQLSVPHSLVVKTRKPAEDFELYFFVRGSDPEDEALLKAYAGNFPRFPGEISPDASFEMIVLGDLKAASIIWKDQEGRFYRKVLVYLPKEFGIPQKVKFEYGQLSGDERGIADSIIESIKPVKD